MVTVACVERLERDVRWLRPGRVTFVGRGLVDVAIDDVAQFSGELRNDRIDNIATLDGIM